MSILIYYLLTIPAIIIAVTAHEYTKAYASTYLGDTIPRNKGRLTLNPLKHLEPIGFICMVMWRFGWGQPTPTSAVCYKDRKWGTIITYTMPSVINILIGYIFAIIATLYANSNGIMGADGIGINTYIVVSLMLVAEINIKMALFNILPIYPLDGAKVLSVLLPMSSVVKMNQYEKVFQIILLLLLFWNIIGMVLNPIADAMLFFAP